MLRLTDKIIILSLCAAPLQALADNTSTDSYLTNFFNFFSEMPEPKPVVNKWVYVKLDGINAIRAGEHINIMIDPKSEHEVQINAPATAFNIEDGTLNLFTRSIGNKKYNVIVRDLNALDYLEMNGNSTIYGNKVKKTNNPLTIVSNNHAKIEIHGMVKINSLEQNSDKSTKITWVDSENLKIDAGKGTITLAGTAKNASIWAHDSANIVLPHLRTENTWISSMQNSHIFTNPIGYFYAHAKDKSLVEHRGNFKTITRITKNTANIIEKQLDREKD